MSGGAPRVLITRAAEDAAGLTQAFGRLGVDSVLVPLLERIWRPDDVLRAVAQHPAPDVVMVTSGTTAQILGTLVPSAWSKARWVAVGPSTAGRLEALGFVVDYVPSRAIGSELAAGLADIDGALVMYPRADLADSGTSEALRERGARVVDIVAYDNRCPEGTAGALAQALPVDATPVMSGSAAVRLAEHVAPENRSQLGRVVAIGPSTAKAAKRAGLHLYAVAEPHTGAGLVAATARALGIRLSP